MPKECLKCFYSLYTCRLLTCLQVEQQKGSITPKFPSDICFEAFKSNAVATAHED